MPRGHLDLEADQGWLFSGDRARCGGLPSDTAAVKGCDAAVRLGHLGEEKPHRTVIVRMRFYEPTIAYVARRTAEGKSKRDILRCLKRYVIREVYLLIKVNPTTEEIAAWDCCTTW